MACSSTEEDCFTRIPPVAIVFGDDVDASATPPTVEHNRLVADMVRHYACTPFTRREGSDDATGLAGDVFEWVDSSLPVVTLDDMAAYHDESYVKYLSVRETLSDVDVSVATAGRSTLKDIGDKSLGSYGSPSRPMSVLLPLNEDKKYNLVGESAPFAGLWKSTCAAVSGSLAAARLLAQPGRFAAIHFFGGKRHAKYASAAGFCYINDVVIAALELRKRLAPTRNSLLIVDIGAQHADGTQEAFLPDPTVMTLSLHAYGVGIYPGTGSLDEIGEGVGRGFAMNIPLPVGATDALTGPLIHRGISAALKRMGDRLGGLIAVCGPDALSGDPLGCLNHSIGGHQSIVRLLLMEAVNRQLKILILGAGGSVDVSCARLAGAVARDVLSCSAALRSGNGDYFRYSPDLEVCRGVSVPEDCKYFSRYGLSFLMHGLPPAVVEKVKILPHDSPLFARMQRVAARVMQNASMETDSDGEVIEDKSGSDDSSEDADTEDEGDEEEEESEEDDETDESDEAYEEEEEEDEVDEDEDESDKWLNF